MCSNTTFSSLLMNYFNFPALMSFSIKVFKYWHSLCRGRDLDDKHNTSMDLRVLIQFLLELAA